MCIELPLLAADSIGRCNTYSLTIEGRVLNMKQRPRIYYNETQKAMMWDRWRRGESLHDIARLFDRHHPSIQRILSETGGIRPPPRSRSGQSMSLFEREENSPRVVAGPSVPSISPP